MHNYNILLLMISSDEFDEGTRALAYCDRLVLLENNREAFWNYVMDHSPYWPYSNHLIEDVRKYEE